VERNRHGLGGVIVDGVIVDGISCRVTDSCTQVVQSVEDVGVAAKQTGDQHGKQNHDHGDDTHQCQHLAPIIGVDRRPRLGGHFRQRYRMPPAHVKDCLERSGTR
jgi:hypothetical protein